MEHIIATLLRDFEQGRMTGGSLFRACAHGDGGVCGGHRGGCRRSCGEGRLHQPHFLSGGRLRQVRDCAGLLDEGVEDDGKQCRLTFATTSHCPAGRPRRRRSITSRTRLPTGTRTSLSPAVEAELKRRGLQIRTTKQLPRPGSDGFEVQMGGKSSSVGFLSAWRTYLHEDTKMTRSARRSAFTASSCEYLRALRDFVIGRRLGSQFKRWVVVLPSSWRRTSVLPWVFESAELLGRLDAVRSVPVPP